MTTIPQSSAAKRTGDNGSPADARLRKERAVYSAPDQRDDGTNQLLRWGSWTLGAGIFFALLTKFVLGGIGPQGPHTNSGWMALIVTMMCLPFGSLLFLLGALKWLRKRRQPGAR
jgi:hypothetical protein